METESELPLRERKKRAMHRSLLERGRTLFLRDGFEQTRIEDIAAAAAVSVPTFYHYYPSKDALLQALVRERLHAWATDVAGRPSVAGSARKQLRAFYRLVAEGMEAEEDLWRSVARADLLNVMRWPEQREAEAAEQSYLEGILAGAQARGEIVSKPEALRLARYLTSMQDHICWEWATHPVTSPRFNLKRELLRGVDFFLQGAMPRARA